MKYTIENENVGVRLDVFLSQIADVTRSRAGTLIKEGNALVNQKPETKTGYAISAWYEESRSNANATQIPSFNPDTFQEGDPPA